jgi:hypothetical protein
MVQMKNKNLIIGLAVAGGVYALWRFIIKPKVINKMAQKSINEYEQFDLQRELIAASLPQETIIPNEVIDTDFEQIT